MHGRMPYVKKRFELESGAAVTVLVVVLTRVLRELNLPFLDVWLISQIA